MKKETQAWVEACWFIFRYVKGCHEEEEFKVLVELEGVKVGE